uniref:Uncharacterized protein n=1 Tax=Anguilla anguilla TaxID=7936 RepID=A0A0E9VJT8_ANGAN
MCQVFLSARYGATKQQSTFLKVKFFFFEKL